jgi:hypothetical protein
MKTNVTTFFMLGSFCASSAAASRSGRVTGRGEQVAGTESGTIVRIAPDGGT